MSGHLLSSDGAECNQLFDALSVAIMRASTLLQQSSIYDLKYLEADTEVSKHLARVNQLLNPVM